MRVVVRACGHGRRAEERRSSSDLDMAGLGRSQCGVGVGQVQVGPEWAGGRYVTSPCSEGARGAPRITVGLCCAADGEGDRVLKLRARAEGFTVYTASWARDATW
jgi:hypothetical protein